MTYDAFSKDVKAALREAGKPLTWTEVRTAARLSQAFPNNKWVRRMEADIGLKRHRDAHGIIHWQLEANTDLFGGDAAAPKATDPKTSRAARKQGALE